MPAPTDVEGHEMMAGLAYKDGKVGKMMYQKRPIRLSMFI